MSKKPEALLLADDLEQTHPHLAAATLRAQHALIEDLRKAFIFLYERCEFAGREGLDDCVQTVSKQCLEAIREQQQ